LRLCGRNAPQGANLSHVELAENEFKPFQSFKTHDLDVLLRLCGREAYIKKRHLADWSAVSRWNPEARYQPVGTISKQEAEQMIAAAIILSKKL
jgi:hypothetical protein